MSLSNTVSTFVITVISTCVCTAYGDFVTPKILKEKALTLVGY
jgi:hypothetical protein